MRALAERADYSPSALYKYFDDKEDILDTLSTEGWQLSLEFQQSHMLEEGATLPEALDGLLRGAAWSKKIHSDAGSLERAVGIWPKIAADDRLGILVRNKLRRQRAGPAGGVDPWVGVGLPGQGVASTTRR
jgi:AcrR family transcriptional regulator